MRRVSWALSVAAIGTFSLFGCSAPSKREAVATRVLSSAAPSSNVLRDDYVGSGACAGCHADIFASWRRSPMHRMTRDIAQTEIAAPFDGRSLSLGPDRMTLELDRGRHFLRLSQPGAESLYRVTKVVGGRYREDFVGEPVELSRPFGSARGPERVMPVSFLLFDGSLRYKGYSVMVPERPGLEVGLVWQRACILCHNTAPQFVGLYDELHGGGLSYQGSATHALPADKAFRYVIDDEKRLVTALESELAALDARGRLPADAHEALAVAIGTTRERLTAGNMVELGVGCESCHGGARAHAAEPDRTKPSFGVRSDFMHVETASGAPLSPAQEINRGCAKCHTVLFSQYPYTWEGGTRQSAPGGSTTNSGEARDFLLGACSSAMTCTTCHDPHGQDSRERLQDLMTPRGNPVCTSCHGALSSPSALRAHAHHSPTGAGGACLACHMPRKNMGLAYDLTTYHRIGSPTDEARVEGDRPLECALCHADRSVRQIVLTMEKWWGRHYDRSRLTRLYGQNLDENSVRVTLIGGKPHEQVVAADVAARHDVPGTLDSTVALLGSPYPLVRHFARHSLERRLGRAVPLDMTLPGAELLRSGRAFLAPPGSKE